MRLCPIILAGGGGTRLWPLSREYYPKQFLSLFDDLSLIQNTIQRLDGISEQIEIIDPIIICNEEHRFLVVEQCVQINKNINKIFLEPEGRNTAPALTIAALDLAEDDEETIMIMMPADHVIKQKEVFHNAIHAACEIAMQDYLVTFGIKPESAETGYGYIHLDTQLQSVRDQTAYRINSFKEKPDSITAEKYLESGEYFWNSGLFIMKSSVWLDKIKSLQIEIYDACKTAYDDGDIDGLFYRLNNDAFLSSPNDSIDYAVMEKLTGNPDEKLAVIPVDMGWSDVGAWSSVWDLKNKDEQGNVVEGDVLTKDTKNCFIRSERGLVTTVACNDLVIVDSDDSILIADRSHAQDVKNIVQVLKSENRKESLLHRKVYRPWGSYNSVDEGVNFQVKRLTVNPGKKLSLQLHNKRAEHWVVVKGIATVTKGDEVFKLNENESTYIPVGVKHRLENETNEILELIEVQSGEYLGEDDIVRFEDDFGRID